MRLGETNVVAVMQATDVFREIAWQLAGRSKLELAAGDSLPDVSQASVQAASALATLHSLSSTTTSSQLAHRLEWQWRALLDQWQLVQENGQGSRAKLRDAAESIDRTAGEIRDIQFSAWEAVGPSHPRAAEWATHAVSLIIALAIGAAIAFGVGRRGLNMAVNVVRDSSVRERESVAHFTVRGEEDIDALSERVDAVIRQLHGKRLHSDHHGELLRCGREAGIFEFASAAAHELRNPLTSVKLLIQNAADRPHRVLYEDESRVMLDEIRRIENTIEGIVAFSCPPPLRRLRHDLRDTLQKAVNVVADRANQHRVTLDLVPWERPMLVDGDPDQLQQACMHLLSHGIEGMPVGGVLGVYAEFDPHEMTVRVDFHDQGSCIPDHILVHIFEPFASIRPGVMRLGLAISRRIVVQHGGSLTAENHAAGGAVFSLELPMIGRDDRPIGPAAWNESLATA